MSSIPEHHILPTKPIALVDNTSIPNHNESDEPDYLRLILNSKSHQAARNTPLTQADTLSDQLGCNVFLKREDLQPVATFKLRGVYNKLAHLPKDKRWRGLITYSCGNQALSVAWAAQKLRIPAMIVIPESTPDATVKRLSRLGGTTILHGSSLDAAREECMRLQQLHNLINVSACDDPLFIAGNGTIGLEILNQADMSRLTAIVCNFGCESLIAGLSIYVKRVAPDVKIIGVKREGESHFSQSVSSETEECSALKPQSSELVGLCAELIDSIVQVTVDEILLATKDAFEDTRHILEPSGAICIAGLKKWAAGNLSLLQDKDIVAITSEANVDYFSIPNVIERTAFTEESGTTGPFTPYSTPQSSSLDGD